MTTDEAIHEISRTTRTGLPLVLLAFFERWYKSGRPATLDIKALGEYVRKCWPEDFDDICREVAFEAQRRGWIATRPTVQTFRFHWTSTSTWGL